MAKRALEDVPSPPMRPSMSSTCVGWALLVLVFPIVTVAAPAKGGASADPELRILEQSLVPARVGAVGRAAKLAELPRYRLDLELDPEKRRLIGRQQLEYSTEVILDELYFRIPANAYWQRHEEQAVRILGARRNGVEVELEARGGVYRLPLDPPLEPGERIALQFDLSVQIPASSAGRLTSPVLALQQAMTLFTGGTKSTQTDYGTFAATDATISLNGFFPEIAPRVGDRFETFEDAGRGELRWGAVANYVVSIVTPEGFVVAGTGTEIGRAPERDGRVRTTRVAAAVRGLALVVSSELTVKTAKAGPVEVRAWAKEANELQQRKMLDTAVRALGYFASQYGPYPWATLEIAAMPLEDGVECVSMPGLIGCSSLLSEPEQLYMMYGTHGAERSVDRVLEASVAHHVAHQWWGGIVGSDRVMQPELDEPIATWASMAYLAHRRGAKASRSAVQTYLHGAYALHRMLGRADAAVARPISQYSGRGEIEALLRGKGSEFYPALRRLVGPKTFAAALRKAVEVNAFREVRADPIVEQAVKLAPGKAKKIRALYERYMRQSHGDEDIGLDAGIAGQLDGMLDPQSRQALQQMLQMLSGQGGGADALLRALGGAAGPAPVPPPQQQQQDEESEDDPQQGP